MLAPYRKAVVAFIGTLVILVNTALVDFAAYIPADVGQWVTTAVAFVTAVSVYLVKNAPYIDTLGDHNV